MICKTKFSCFPLFLIHKKIKKDGDESPVPLAMSSRHALSRLRALSSSWGIAIGCCRFTWLRPNRSPAGGWLLRWSDPSRCFCCLQEPSPFTVSPWRYLTGHRFGERANQDLHSLPYGVFFSIPSRASWVKPWFSLVRKIT